MVSAASKVGEKCFPGRNMELQGLQEALKVEIQCHQVNETSCCSRLQWRSEQRAQSCSLPGSNSATSRCLKCPPAAVSRSRWPRALWAALCLIAVAVFLRATRMWSGDNAVLLLVLCGDQDATWIFMKRCKECGFVNLRHFFLHVVAQMKRQPQVIMAGLCEKLYRLKPALREVSPLCGGLWGAYRGRFSAPLCGLEVAPARPLKVV